MTRKPTWRYKCDHCGKTGYSAGHMARHERGCTLNPERVCGMCKWSLVTQAQMGELIAALGKGDEAGVRALRDVANNCPACMLAAIRCSGIRQGHYPNPDDPDGPFLEAPMIPFKFKEEHEVWLSCMNERDV